MFKWKVRVIEVFEKHVQLLSGAKPIYPEPENIPFSKIAVKEKVDNI